MGYEMNCVVARMGFRPLCNLGKATLRAVDEVDFYTGMDTVHQCAIIVDIILNEDYFAPAAILRRIDGLQQCRCRNIVNHCQGIGARGRVGLS